MKLIHLAMAVAATCVFAQTAQARGYHHRYGYRHHASRHILSQRHLTRAAYPYEEETTYQSWGQSQFGYPTPSRHRRYAERREGRRGYFAQGYDAGYSDMGYSAHTAYRGGLGPRPAAWCGWEMRQLVGADPGPQYNLARNWSHWGRPGPAGVGAIVVWPHHVGKIVSQENGEWVIESGNDGHRLRTRPRSIGGAIAIRWG